MGWFSNIITDTADALGIGAQRRQQEFNSAQAQIQRDWETQMSNTAIQRQVADMEKAGINPAMAFSNGANGASTPSGAAASSSGGFSGNLGNVINSAANMVRAFNNDKDKNNNVDFKQTMNLINTVAKLIK